MTTKLGPWPLGIDNVSRRGALIRNDEGAPVALADAANVDIDRDGRPSRRAGQELVQAGAMHSLWSGPGGAFCAVGTSLRRTSATGAVEIGQLNSPDPCTYAVLNDSVLVANRTTLLRVDASGVRDAGLPNSAAPLIHPATVGGLYGGRYAVAVAALVGQEIGGLSPIRTVTVPDGGGIHLAAVLPAGATGLRVYRSRAGGGELYRCDDLAAPVDDYLLGDSELGAEEATRGLRRMPVGEHVAAWQGRVLVGHGRTLFVGEPMRYGLYSPRHGFVQFAERISFVAPVQSGVFVGLQSTVVFLRGERPKDWAQVFTGSPAPIPRSAALLEADQHRLEFQGPGAVWLSRSGYIIGTSEGAVLMPQASRLAIPQYDAGATCIYQRKALTVVK